MKKIHVGTGKPYDIIIERGIIKNAADYIRPLTKAVRAVIVSDSNVAPIYADTVKKSLQDSGFETSVFVFDAGEQSKRLSAIEKMYTHFYEHNITRTDIAVALGGGVTGDMTGFAAASYLRGIDFVQIPTSLLSQVDSSVGGKTGVDLPAGKNLVGAFHQPVTVLIDPDTLDTLPEKFRTDGMGEVVKYGCIRSLPLFEKLENENAWDIIDDIIYECVSIKRDVVERDERDTGERAILNFGHTFGHAIEKLGNYTEMTHGCAIAAGAAMLTGITEEKGLTQAGSAERLKRVLKKYDLPTTVDYSLSEIIAATRGDKKSSGRGISFIFLKKIGECYINKIATEDIRAFFGVN